MADTDAAAALAAQREKVAQLKEQRRELGNRIRRAEDEVRRLEDALIVETVKAAGLTADELSGVLEARTVGPVDVPAPDVTDAPPWGGDEYVTDADI